MLRVEIGEKLIKDSHWEHTKSGVTYVIVGRALLQSSRIHELEGMHQVIYCRLNNPDILFAREQDEFEAKFTKLYN